MNKMYEQACDDVYRVPINNDTVLSVMAYTPPPSPQENRLMPFGGGKCEKGENVNEKGRTRDDNSVGKRK